MTKSTNKKLIKTPSGVVDTDTGEVIEYSALTTNNIQETTLLSRYDSTGLNIELEKQINLVKSNPYIISQIELFKLFEYSSQQFRRWIDKFGNTSRTAELIQKRTELIEANLIEHGKTIKNWPFIIFILKNHYGYQDVKDINTEHSVTFNVHRGDIKPLNKSRRKVIDQQ